MFCFGCDFCDGKRRHPPVGEGGPSSTSSESSSDAESPSSSSSDESLRLLLLLLLLLLLSLSPRSWLDSSSGATTVESHNNKEGKRPNAERFTL
jgi:hypothetical protein